MATRTAFDPNMTGLEDRLRSVAGIVGITIELGEEGLEGIRVRLEDGADESEVLEEIRRILIAYGLKPRSFDAATGRLPLPEILPDAPAVAPSAEPHVSMRGVGDRVEVKLADEHHEVVKLADASALGSAEAMVRAVAEWFSLPVPNRVAVSRLKLDGEDVVAVLLRSRGKAAAAAGHSPEGLVKALYMSTRSALETLDA